MGVGQAPIAGTGDGAPSLPQMAIAQLKNHLKPLGFTKSRQLWSRERGEAVQLIALQKDREGRGFMVRAGCRFASLPEPDQHGPMKTHVSFQLDILLRRLDAPAYDVHVGDPGSEAADADTLRSRYAGKVDRLAELVDEHILPMLDAMPDEAAARAMLGEAEGKSPLASSLDR